MRPLLIFSMLGLFLGSQVWAEDALSLKPRHAGRFEVSLPTGQGWDERSGDNWSSSASQIRTDQGVLYIWASMEANVYPANRYDWLAAEISREVRDSEVFRLLDEAAKTGEQLVRLDYAEARFGENTSHYLVWAHNVFVESLGKTVPEYQELHVFLAPDHARDFSFLSVYFGVVCLAECTSDFPDAETLRPVLDTIVMTSLE